MQRLTHTQSLKYGSFRCYTGVTRVGVLMGNSEVLQTKRCYSGVLRHTLVLHRWDVTTHRRHSAKRVPVKSLKFSRAFVWRSLVDEKNPFRGMRTHFYNDESAL